MGVFVGGLSRCFGQKWGSGGHLSGRLGGLVSRPHPLWALDVLCTNLSRHVGKVKFEKAPTPG
jgi:hypothetical protein